MDTKLDIMADEATFWQWRALMRDAHQVLHQSGQDAARRMLARDLEPDTD